MLDQTLFSNLFFYMMSDHSPFRIPVLHSPTALNNGAGDEELARVFQSIDEEEVGTLETDWSRRPSHNA